VGQDIGGILLTANGFTAGTMPYYRRLIDMVRVAPERVNAAGEMHLTANDVTVLRGCDFLTAAPGVLLGRRSGRLEKCFLKRTELFGPFLERCFRSRFREAIARTRHRRSAHDSQVGGDGHIRQPAAPLTHRSTVLASRVAQAAFAGDANRAGGLRPLNWTWPVQTLPQTRPWR
jgi:hypothetical protein